MVVSLLKGIRYNMEILDIYDEHGNLTGRTAERSTFLSKGDYFLCAHVILENQDGLFLVQKRSDTKATRPGQWDITAGAVDAGETSLDGALREAKEEIGLTLPREKMRFLFRDRRRSCYHDVYYIKTDFALSDCTMQESEVQALDLVTDRQLLELVDRMTHRSSNYKRRLEAFLQKRKA